MATKLQIWNRTLRKIGEQREAGLTDNTVNGRILADNYEDDKRAVLEMHSWKFARKLKSLALNSNSPEFGYENSFELPSDCLKIVSFNDTDPLDRQKVPFTVVGTELHTDESVAKIVYISSDTPEGQFSAGFVEALCIFMAANIAYARTKSQPLMDRMDQKFERALARAKRDDSAMDITPRASILSFPNLAARFTGVRYPNGTL